MSAGRPGRGWIRRVRSRTGDSSEDDVVGSEVGTGIVEKGDRGYCGRGLRRDRLINCKFHLGAESRRVERKIVLRGFRMRKTDGVRI